jgi:hypothetical protein
MHALVIGLAAILGSAAHQPAASASESMSASNPRCTWRTARAATVEAARTDRHLETRCVRLRGLMVGDRLHADREAMAEAAGARGRTARRSLPLLTDGAQKAFRWRGPAAEVEALGVVQSCETAQAMLQELRQAEPDMIVTLAGLCHVSHETYLDVSSVRRVSRQPVYRLTEEEVPAAMREMVAAPMGAPGVEAHRAAARQLVGAVERRDPDLFARLNDPDMERPNATARGRERQQAAAAAQFRRASAANSAARAIMPLAGRQEQLFVHRDDADATDTAGEGSADGGEDRAVTCWCRTSDCTGRWPVREADADNDPARPYVCVLTSDYYVGRHVIQARFPEASSALAEPPAPVSRASPSDRAGSGSRSE